MADHSNAERSRGPLGLVIRLVSRAFGDIRPGEGVAVVALLFNIMLLLAAYYLLKTVREPWIIASGGAAQKSYASAYQAAALIGFVPAYGWFAKRVGRLQLVVGVTLLFALCTELFAFGRGADIAGLGIVFYVWVGIFSLAMIAQFWSYANDVYSRTDGERLFPIIAIGMTAGAPIGSYLAKQLFDAGVSPVAMLHMTAAALVAHLTIYLLINTRMQRGAREGKAEKRLEGPNGFTLVWRNRYITLIAGLLILLNLVNTTGEYILSDSVTRATAADIAKARNLDAAVTQMACEGDVEGAAKAFDGANATARAAVLKEECGKAIGGFYGDFFTIVNIVGVLMQAFLASRLVRFFGMAGVLLALPLVSLGAYGLVGAGLGLAVLRWAKTAENSTDYSIMNTAKAMLWLPTTRAEKYNAKQAVDTFFVRIGDLLSAGLVFVGTTQLGLASRGFALINLGFIALWLLVAFRLLRGYKRLVASKESDAT